MVSKSPNESDRVAETLDASELPPETPLGSPAPRTDGVVAIPDLLGAYRIEKELGRGGMGIVFAAVDTRLERRVALKVLPHAVGDAPEALERFEQEAKLLASLNHPNIATLHSLEEEGGIRFFTLELIPGASLDRVIDGLPLEPERAISICRQIAAGLEVAHGNGVIHCDLKPANIQVTPDGEVKVLDFGVARALGKNARRGDPGESSILGTPGYMSPEQFTGDDVDGRTDVWALGCLLYECLTGARAFPGATLEEVYASTMEQEPDWDVLPPATPQSVQELLASCLIKETAQRLAEAREAREVLEEAAKRFEGREYKDIEESVSSILRSTVKVGDRMPPFELRNTRGELVRSEDLLAAGPLVICFYRGKW